MWKLFHTKSLFGLLTGKKIIGILNMKNPVVCGIEVLFSQIFFHYFLLNATNIDGSWLNGWKRC